MMNRSDAGLWLLRGVAGVTLLGGFAADWNRTHLFNPRWTPHSKFHDAMTISLGAFAGAAALVLCRSARSRRNLRLAALLPASFYAAQALAFVYPGTAGIDAEFPHLVPRVRGITLNELPFALLMLSLTGLGFALARASAEPALPRERWPALRATGASAAPVQ